MNKPPVISIIVPVYNAEKYLKQCIESILAQSYGNFELLLINDGSKDSSGSICDQFAAQDNRLRVFHKANGGVSSARNLGIENAVGDYIAFVDADDFLDSRMYELLVADALKNSSDISYCGYVSVNNSTELYTFYYPMKIEKGRDELLCFLAKGYYLLPIWSCLISRAIIEDNGLRFVENCRYGEDQEFIIKSLCHCRIISNVNECLYYYINNDDSALAQLTINQFDYPIAMIRTKNYLVKLNMNGVIIDLFDKCKIPISILFVLRLLVNSKIKKNEIINFIEKEHLHLYIPKIVDLHHKKWIQVLLWNISPTVYFLFFQLAGRIKMMYVSNK